MVNPPLTLNTCPVM